MNSIDNPMLTIRTRDGDCTVILEGDSLLNRSHNNVRKLFRKLVECAGDVLEYDALERELYGNEPRPPQGAYNTKNAVRGLRTALFPFEPRDGKQKWRSPLAANGKLLLLIEKPHASRICLTLPQSAEDPDVYLDLEVNVKSGVVARPTGSAPFTVPVAQSRHFYGRDNVMTEVHERLNSGSCVAVCGAGGMGKTQLAAEYAHVYKNSYPGGVYWIDAKDAQTVQEEFAELSRDSDNFRAPQDLPIDERVNRVRERFQQMDEPSLMILDSLVADQELLRMLPTTGRCRILVTTRRQSLLKSRFYVVDLTQLDDDAALLALQCCCTVEETADRLAAREPDLRKEDALAREIAAVRQIRDELNQRLPLTITLIAFYVYQRKTTFEECRRRLEANSLKVFERAEVGYSIRDAFTLSKGELTEQALRVLATAACFARRNISPELLRTTSLIVDEEQFEDAVTLLDLSSFISLEQNGRITMHDVLRDITLEQIDSKERGLLLRRTASTLAVRVEHANETMEWVTVKDEVVQCRAVIAACRRHSLHPPLAALLCEMGQYYRLHDENDAALKYFDEAARVTAAHVPDDLRMLAKCGMQASATDPMAAGAIKSARQALYLARNGAVPGDLELAEYYNVCGYVLDKNGRHWRALPFYRRALRLCEASAGRRSVPAGEYLNNIGVVYESTLQHRMAAEYLSEALDIFMQFYGQKHRRVAIALNNLGRVQRALGDSMKALESHQGALHIFETHYGTETKDFAMSLYFVSGVLSDLGHKEEATARTTMALEILERRYGTSDGSACRVRRSLESGSY